MSERIIAIDWSGAKRGGRGKIWIAEARAGEILRLENGRTRRQASDWLIEQAMRDERLIAGFDFAFSMPQWFLEREGIPSAPDLWRRCHEGAAERWLDACKPPFWGRAGKPSVPAGAPLRRCDRGGAKSVFQIGGAGAVGTGSLRGMVELHRLREAGFRAWPFDAPGFPMALEIYPRAMTGPVVKSSASARRAYVDDRYAALPLLDRALAASTEDVFDAAVSALVMDAHRDELVRLPAVHDSQIRLEGAIWHPRWSEDEL